MQKINMQELVCIGNVVKETVRFKHWYREGRINNLFKERLFLPEINNEQPPSSSHKNNEKPYSALQKPLSIET